MRIIVATIVRDEADRYLPSALAAWSEFADEIVAIDNGSTDGTSDLLDRFGAEIYCGYDAVLGLDLSEPMWGNEAPFRESLYGEALAEAEDDDIIFFLDADMVPLKDPREIMEGGGDLFFFNLYDIWGVNWGTDGSIYYRNEAPFWIASRGRRPWAIRASLARRHPYDATRGIHCGHLPQSAIDDLEAEHVFLPPRYGLLHYGYATPADRERAASRYAESIEAMSRTERDHAATILDEPNSVKMTLLMDGTSPARPEWPLRRAT